MCQKNGRRGCRFDCPKDPSPETRLKTNANGGNKARFYVIKREPGAEMVNPYNEHILRAWRANMDIQVVGSVYGAALYVTHHICKDESQVLKQVIGDQLAYLLQDATVKQWLRKIGNILLSHWQLNQLEAAFLVADLHLKGSSHATVFVSKRQRTQLVRPLHQLQEKDQLQFLNAEYGLFADEVQQAIHQMSSLQNMYGDNLYAPVAPNAVQETLGAGALESEFDPLYDGDVNIEENAPEVHDANRQEVTTNDNGDLQAALFDDT